MAIDDIRMFGNIGGRPQSQFGLPDYMTPGGGIGGGLPEVQARQQPQQQPGLGQNMLDTSVAPDPYAGQRTEEAADPEYFSKGRRWRDALGYGLGAIAQQFGGSNPYDLAMKRQGDQRDDLRKLRLAAQLKAAQGQEPDAFERKIDYLRRSGHGDVAEQLISNQGLPPMQAVDITNPDGSVSRTFIRPPSSAPAAQSGQLPQIGAVIDLDDDEGGQTPPASGSFR